MRLFGSEFNTKELFAGIAFVLFGVFVVMSGLAVFLGTAFIFLRWAAGIPR